MAQNSRDPRITQTSMNFKTDKNWERKKLRANITNNQSILKTKNVRCARHLKNHNIKQKRSITSWI